MWSFPGWASGSEAGASSVVSDEKKEDDLDDELFQFPAYGSHAANQGGSQPDWLNLGGLNATTVSSPPPGEVDGDEMTVDGQEEHRTSKAADETGETKSMDSDDWDEEEQCLWKKKAKKDVASPITTSLSVTVSSLDPQGRRQEWIQHNEREAARAPPSSVGEAARPLKHSSSEPNELATAPTSSRRYFSSSFRRQQQALQLLEEQQHDRQHWMPDQLCKQCYACDAPFSVFKRRHHCRLCGQVFCNTCSAYFVSLPSSSGSNSTTTTVRVCQMCNEQVAHMGGLATTSSLATTGGDKPSLPQQPQQPHSPEHGGVINVFESPTDQLRKPPLLTEQISLGDNTRNNPDSVLESLSRQRLELLQARNSNSTNNLLALEQMAEESEQRARSRRMSPRKKETTSQDIVAPQAKPWMAATAPLATFEPAVGSKEQPALLSRETSRSSVRTSSSALVQEGNVHLGLTAASHLEKMADNLLRIHAPLLWEDLECQHPFDDGQAAKTSWINKLLSLATRCCATVDPSVKKGDLLDIRPYCKVKTIPGGSYQHCAYMSGVVFRKTVSHKKMAREILNPRIMLLSGGIEFTRTENRIASLETLFEQEEKYMEILVGKILKLQPNVLLVGRSVSRRAQELLLKADVVLVQHVKASLLNRISRQTGATIISSTDHVMNQFGASVLGSKCRRFRLVTFRDNEAWMDAESEVAPGTETELNSSIDASAPSSSVPGGGPPRKSIQALLADPKLSNHERQAALAASMLGEDVLDGTEAVKSGLAKRGVAQTYVMLEGCPKQLGCSVVLRGANRAALKQVKIVFRFLVNVAYNLRLETSYLRERSARLRPDYEVKPQNIYSSSLCVDYGKPPAGRNVRPWNGSDASPNPESGPITAFDHQSILITSIWMTDKTQCCPAEVKGICYYSLQDVALGQFLRDSCFNLSLKCQNPNCKKSVLDHSLSFVHNDGLINIMVEELDEPLPPSPMEPVRDRDDDAEGNSDDDDEEEEVDKPIATWTYCKCCGKVVTPLVFISEETWKFSFGKFLEVLFYNRDAILNAQDHSCTCQLQSQSTLYFGCGNLAARFTYERIQPFNVFVRRNLPLDLSFHKAETLRRLDIISLASSDLFVKFDKHIARISRDARSLFNSAVNRPEHLQTVLSELNRIGSEVDHAAKTLQEKIASVSDKCRKDNDTANEALLRFPWFARRYLFMLTSAWNEKIVAAGQAISAMKKLAASAGKGGEGVLGPNVSVVVGDPASEELLEAMKRLRQLNEHYARYNVTDITQVLPSLPESTGLQQDGEYDDEFDDPDTSMDFSDGVDADVLASRRRLRSAKEASQPVPSKTDRSQNAQSRPTKSLGTRRSVVDSKSRQSQDPSLAQPKVTPGGAVKSAINRFFNRGGREYEDLYVVDLGVFAEGRPRLAAGVNGVVVPVMDEQWSTIIAYSLSSAEYAKQFKHYLKAEATENDIDMPGPRKAPADSNASKEPSSSTAEGGKRSGSQESKNIERQMLVRNKSHIKHTFRDFDDKGQLTCKFVCTSYWATQFHAVRQVFLSEGNSSLDVEESFVESLSSAYSWAASGGKSGASFARTSDDRFVIKCISRTELQMFLDCAPAYFEYLSKAFFHGLPTVLCKIVGVFQIGIHDKVAGKRSMEQVAVMQNIFYNRKITKIFDLKGSLRGRFAAQVHRDDAQPDTPSDSSSHRRRNMDPDRPGRGLDHSLVDDSKDKEGTAAPGLATLLDGDFLEFTLGRPMPMTDRAKAVFQMSILNDTLFLSIINVLDYSILVGVDEEKMELVVGIIDFMRQYDILKQMERVGKSLPMVVGSEAPTIIQPPLYKARFTNAMERYFMTVPSKWTTI